MKKLLCLIAALAMLFTGAFASEEGGQLDCETTTEPERFTLVLMADYQKNLFFNTYDISVYVDGAEIGVMSQGDERMEKLDLSWGEHEIRVVSHTREKHKDSVVFMLTGDEYLIISCKAKWTGLRIVSSKILEAEQAE